MESTKRSRPEAYLEPYQTFTKKLFQEIVKVWKPLTIFAKSSVLDVCWGSEYTSVNTYYAGILLYTIKEKKFGKIDFSHYHYYFFNDIC